MVYVSHGPEVRTDVGREADENCAHEGKKDSKKKKNVGFDFRCLSIPWVVANPTESPAATMPENVNPLLYCPTGTVVGDMLVMACVPAAL